MEQSSLISVQNVAYVYASESGSEYGALSNVSLDVRPGEFVAIIGHNGSGKSTLAKHFNCLLMPTQGDVFVNGWNTKDPSKLWDIRQTVGMVFQNPDNQLVATTVEEDVAFGPENLGLPPAVIRDRVDEALEAVGMSEWAGREPHNLSGGQKQRVAIAGVIAMRPRCIVLDEPTAMLDPSGREEVMATIRRLNKTEGIAVVHITHFMDEAIDADRVVVMEAGRIVMSGTPEEVFQQVERLQDLHLDVPPVTMLAESLRKEGVPLPAGMTRIDEMVKLLCQLS
ncbi:MAG: energy-coupling factor transporter ATPase [Firmicutes bacterium]|nr:energy-coupling factor transporter ATPase [Bacillota bacterium]